MRAPVECSLIWTVVEHLQELTSTQVEHKLRVNTEIVRQPEARRVFLPIICELLTQSNEHAVQPPEHIRRVVDLCLEHRNARHQDGSCFLIKGRSDARRVLLSEIARNRRDAQALLARRMLIVRHELNEPAGTRLEGLSIGCDNFEVDGGCGARSHGVDLPRRRLAHSNLSLADAGGLLAS